MPTPIPPSLMCLADDLDSKQLLGAVTNTDCMSNNIPDPPGVAALLDQLRSSKAWQDVISQQAHSPQESSSTTSAPPTPSVASLLSQLQHQPTSLNRTISPTPHIRSGDPSAVPPIPVDPRPPRPSLADSEVDPKTCSFQQALPLLGRLSEDSNLLTCLATIRSEQDHLEKRLWAEREAITHKYEEKVKVAQTKASITGVGLSQHEVTMLKDSHKQELQKFDLQRALPAWDGLVSQQQARLEALNVPCMSVTDIAAERQKQQRVVQVLEGLVNAT